MQLVFNKWYEPVQTLNSRNFSHAPTLYSNRWLFMPFKL